MSHDDEALVNRLYRVLLGREPDPFGYAGHLRRLRTGGVSYEDLALGILASEEFKTRSSWSATTAAGLNEVISWIRKSKLEKARQSNPVTISRAYQPTREMGLGEPNPARSHCVF